MTINEKEDHECNQKALYVNVSARALDDPNVLRYTKDTLPIVFNAYLGAIPVYIVYDTPSRVKSFLKEFLRTYAKGSTYEDKLAALVDMNLGV